MWEHQVNCPERQHFEHVNQSHARCAIQWLLSEGDLWIAHTPALHNSASTGCNIHVDRGLTASTGVKNKTKKQTLTAITSSKGCLYTRTGDWYFCTMVGVTVTPTTWTRVKSMRKRTNTLWSKTRKERLRRGAAVHPLLASLQQPCAECQDDSIVAASGPTTGDSVCN